MTGSASTDFTILGMYVDRKRICSRMRKSDVARICAIPADDVHRVIYGKSISQESLHALCDWLERPISFFEINELATKREAYP